MKSLAEMFKDAAKKQLPFAPIVSSEEQQKTHQVTQKPGKPSALPKLPKPPKI